MYIPRYFTLRIYNYITNYLRSINTHPNTKERDYNYKRIVIIYKSFIKEGYLGVKEPKVIRVAILP
jgi:hypothetical protein